MRLWKVVTVPSNLIECYEFPISNSIFVCLTRSRKHQGQQKSTSEFLVYHISTSKWLIFRIKHWIFHDSMRDMKEKIHNSISKKKLLSTKKSGNVYFHEILSSYYKFYYVSPSSPEPTCTPISTCVVYSATPITAKQTLLYQNDLFEFSGNLA